MTSGVYARWSADAIIVLGCRISRSGRPSPAALRRADSGARAYLQARAARCLIVSGGRRWGLHVEADAIAGALIERGVPADVIIRERLSLATFENAVFSVALMRSAPDCGLSRGQNTRPRVVLVTCSWHMARARCDFERAGCDVVSFPAQAPSQAFATRALNAAAERVRTAFDARALRAWRM